MDVFEYAEVNKPIEPFCRETFVSEIEGFSRFTLLFTLKKQVAPGMSHANPG